MAFIRKINGQDYICKSKHKTKKGKQLDFKDIFLIKSHMGNLGYLHIGSITFPERILGERIRLRVEVVK